jgi:AcrR family transcriptional regulator
VAARRRAFLEAATAVFLEKGYANATLADVIARSGGSMQTLYYLFGGKQGLFEALIAERHAEALAEVFAPFRAEDLLERAPDDVLVAVGTRFLQAIMTPQALSLYRLVAAESMFMKELAERFWAMGPAHVRALIAEYFEQQTRRRILSLQDPEQAAHQFWGMLLGGSFHMQCLLGLREAPEPEEIEASVRTSVALFLDGCRAR